MASRSPSPTLAAQWSRRSFLVAGGSSVLLALAGCAPGANAGGAGTGGASGPIQLASMWSDELPRGVVESLVKSYGSSKVRLSTTPIEDYKTQIRSFLSAESSPDVLTWFAGERTRFFVEQGLIADISEVFEGAASGFAPAFKSLATTDGKQFFLPSQWYWWGFWYRKSVFAENGYTVPTKWDDFIGLLDKMKTDGLHPITIGTRTTPWTSAGWFDYLNLRINGYEYHTALTAGKESYTDERTVAVFDKWEELLPYFDPNAGSYAWQEAVTPLVDRSAGLYLMGRFLTDAAPEADREDFDFFRFPIIDDSIEIAEEAPTDGYFASSRSKNLQGAKDLLSFFASVPGQQPWVEKAGQVATAPDMPSDLYSPLVQKGIAHIEGTTHLSQFYDRDTHPEMATVGMDAFVEFMANPGRKKEILGRLQEQAERIFAS